MSLLITLMLSVVFIGDMLLYKFTFKIPQFIYLKVIDIYFYIKFEKWKEFNKFGIYIFLRRFGAGKTITMVNIARSWAEKYEDMKILTNITLTNFPEHTKIIPLINNEQIIEAEDQTLVLLDEIGAIMNSRNWKNNIPPNLLEILLQQRKRRICILGTAQFWDLTDKLIRKISFYAIECFTFKGRLTYFRAYNAEEYEKTLFKVDYKPRPVKRQSFIQTDLIRSSYDTNELVQQFKKEEFISNSEILANAGGNVVDMQEGAKPKKSLFRKVVSK